MPDCAAGGILSCSYSCFVWGEIASSGEDGVLETRRLAWLPISISGGK